MGDLVVLFSWVLVYCLGWVFGCGGFILLFIIVGLVMLFYGVGADLLRFIPLLKGLFVFGG